MPHVTYGWNTEELDKSIFCNLPCINDKSPNEKRQLREVTKNIPAQQNVQSPAVQTLHRANISTDIFYLDRKQNHLNNTSDYISKDSYLKTVNLISVKELKRQSKITPCAVERYHPTKFQYSSFCHREGNVRSSVFDFDFSSTLGQLLTYNFQIPNNPSVDYDHLITKYEKYCSTNESSSQKFFLRDRTIVNFPVTYSLVKYPNKYSSHEYCFNSQQKTERKRTFLTGLNKRARRLKRLCKPCFVNVKLLKLTRQLKPSCQCSVRLKRLLIDSFPSIDNHCKSSHHLKDNFQTSSNVVDKQLKITENDQETLLNYLNYKTSPPNIGKEMIIDGETVIDLCSDDDSSTENELSSSTESNCSEDKFNFEKENLHILPCQKNEYKNIHLRSPQITSLFPYLNKNVQSNNSNANLNHSAQRTLKENENYLFNINNSPKHRVSPNKQLPKKVPSVYKTFNGRIKNKTKCYVALENVENLLNASEKGTFYVKGTRIFLSNPTLLQKQTQYFDLNRKYLNPNNIRYPRESVYSEIETENQLNAKCSEFQFPNVNSLTANGNSDPHENGGNKNCLWNSKNVFSSSEATEEKNIQNNLDGDCTVVYVSPNIHKKNHRTNEIANDLSDIKRKRVEAVTKMDDNQQNSFCFFNGLNDSMNSVLSSPLSKKTCTFYKNDSFQKRNPEYACVKSKYQFSESLDGNRVLSGFRNMKLPTEINSSLPTKKKCPLTVFKCLTCNYVTTLHDNSTNFINHHIFYKHGGIDNVTVMKQTTKGADLILYKTFVNENSSLMPKS